MVRILHFGLFDSDANFITMNFKELAMTYPNLTSPMPKRMPSATQKVSKIKLKGSALKIRIGSSHKVSELSDELSIQMIREKDEKLKKQ